MSVMYCDKCNQFVDTDTRDECAAPSPMVESDGWHCPLFDGDETTAVQGLLPCGHPLQLLIKSVESNYSFCELCECQSLKKDAQQREQELSTALAAKDEQIAALRKDVQTCRKALLRIADGDDLNDMWETAGAALDAIATEKKEG